MEITSVKILCKQLISLAIQRCRLSGDPCRLSVIIRRSIISDLPLTNISISDTGAGSCLKEFQALKYDCYGFCSAGWDGMLSITTTGFSDVELFHYSLNLKESTSNRRLTKLPSTSKKNAKFSGTEVSMSTAEDMEAIVSDITSFFRKILILTIKNIALELVADCGDQYGVQSERIVLASELTSLPSAESSNTEQLTSGLEDYVCKHRNAVTEKCQSCFSSSENLKVGSGVVHKQKHEDDVLVVEAVIMISESVEPSSPTCLKAFEPKTEVLYFRDFSPCSVCQSDLKVLSNINWSTYGLVLRNITDAEGSVLLEWETLPENVHIDIVLHLYNKQYPSKVKCTMPSHSAKVVVPPLKQRTQVERKLIKKSIILALDDLKEKHTGLLLSTHAVKIHSYAPDLARSIAGLILSSDDHNFQGECLCLLGMKMENIEGDTVEKCIKDKIISAIDMNDKKPRSLRCRETVSYLFGDDHFQEPEFMYGECEEGEDECYTLMEF